MTSDNLKNQIDSLISHVLFDYNGKPCGVDPINHHHFDVWCGDKVFSSKSINEVMETPFFDGKSLEEICNDITNIEI